MKINFLGQGFESISVDSIGNHITKLLKDSSYHTFTIISAFTSTSAVAGLQKILEAVDPEHTSKTVITGVDQFATSKEALEILLNTNVDSYLFHQPSSSIFHPKIYLFESDAGAVVIIGSSNLTANGLFVNVESSLKLVVDKDENEYSVIDDLKAYFKSLFDLSDPNLKKLNQELIDNLVALKIVPTEAEKRQLYRKADQQDVSLAASGTNSTGTVLFPKREKSKIPSDFIKKAVAVAVQIAAPTVASVATGSGVIASTGQIVSSPAPAPVPAMSIAIPTAAPALGQLVWHRGSLPSSSVQHSAAGTNPTGGLRLVQANFAIGGVVIDQTTYFRNLFGAYPWAQVRTLPFVEVSVVPFELEILGVSQGPHTLEVRHKPTGAAGQGNYTTSISWGTAAAAIQAQNLTGRSLSLYAPFVAGAPYKIVIN